MGDKEKFEGFKQKMIDDNEKKSLLILIIVISVIFTGCKAVMMDTATISNEKQIDIEEPINKYIIAVDYDNKANILKGHEKIIYNNNQSKEVPNIVLYLYPNMYRNIESLPAIGSAEKCYPEGFNPGYIELSNIIIDGKKIEKPAADELNGIYIDLPLDKPIKVHNNLEIEMDFEVKIPISTTRFGKYKDITQFTYWYPVLAAQEEGEWEIRDYYTIGESNYSHIADYHVEIKLPREEKVASTGSIICETISSEEVYKILKIEAENVRDFTWVSSPNFVIEESIVDGIKVKSFYTPKNKELGSKADEIGADVIAYFNNIFGLYAYKEFDIVETYLTGGGMEYPQLITLGQSHYKDIDKLNSVIAHEGAHQWWYVAVGNDEHEAPWLDEGFANYSGQLYLAYNAKTDDNINSLMKKYESLQAADIAIEASVTSFNTWKDYNDVIYKKGALALHKLRNYTGDDKFFYIMQAYYNKFKLKNAKTSDFLSVVQKIAGEDAVDIVDLH